MTWHEITFALSLGLSLLAMGGIIVLLFWLDAKGLIPKERSWVYGGYDPTVENPWYNDDDYPEEVCGVPGKRIIASNRRL